MYFFLDKYRLNNDFFFHFFPQWTERSTVSHKTVSHNTGREMGCLRIYVLFLRHHWKLKFFVFQSFSPTHKSHFILCGNLTRSQKELFTSTFLMFLLFFLIIILSSWHPVYSEVFVLFSRTPRQHNKFALLAVDMGAERLCVNRTALAQNIKTEEMLPAQRSKFKLRQNPVCGTSYIIPPLARSWFSPRRSTVTEGQVCLFVCVSERLKVCNEEVNQACVQMSEKDKPNNKPTGQGKLIPCCLKWCSKRNNMCWVGKPVLKRDAEVRASIKAKYNYPESSSNERTSCENHDRLSILCKIRPAHHAGKWNDQVKAKRRQILERSDCVSWPSTTSGLMFQEGKWSQAYGWLYTRKASEKRMRWVHVADNGHCGGKKNLNMWSSNETPTPPDHLTITFRSADMKRCFHLKMLGK